MLLSLEKHLESGDLLVSHLVSPTSRSLIPVSSLMPFLSSVAMLGASRPPPPQVQRSRGGLTALSILLVIALCNSLLLTDDYSERLQSKSSNGRSHMRRSLEESRHKLPESSPNGARQV